MATLRKIAVIIPVYKNIALTEKCIEHCLPSILLESGQLILIDDASPEPGMNAMLEKWRRRYPQTITVITNASNQGFTASVNLGLKVAKGKDVVLLNSDAITPRHWLQVLLKEASKNKLVGTITPLSNNSTITSIPLKNAGSVQFLDFDVDQINSAFDYELPLIPSPTGIGFCMFISADCLARTGRFDVENFGKGYGEENDFCQRALKAGFLNALSGNLYCHHVGSVSFGESSSSRMEAANHTMHRLHPNYHIDVSNWIARDPLGPCRILRTLQVVKRVGLPIVLHVNHGLGGGTTKYVHSILANTSEKVHHVILKGRRNPDDHISITFGWPFQSAFEEIVLKDNGDVLRLLDALGIDCVHIHHLAGVPADIVSWIQAEKSPPHIITFHDYYLIRGNPFLTDSAGEYVGIQASPLDSPLNGVCSHPFSYESWFTQCEALIKSSACNIFPSKDTHARYCEAFSDVPNARIVPHDNIHAITQKPNGSLSSKHGHRKYKIAALGALSVEKGADFLEKIAQVSSRIRHSRLQFQIIGYAYRQLKSVEQTGPYADEDLGSLIARNHVDCLIFASRCPETYSYTLSQAIYSGLPIIAPAFGSFEERLLGYPESLLYPPGIELEELVGRIHAFLDSRVSPSASLPLDAPKPTINDYYLTDYLALLDVLRSQARAVNPAIVYEIVQKSLPLGGHRKEARKRVLNIAIGIYRHPLISPIARIVPFQLIRSLKEWVYPWPIQIDKNRGKS